MIILWLPTFWSSKILWPRYFSFQKCMIPQYIWDPPPSEEIASPLNGILDVWTLLKSNQELSILSPCYVLSIDKFYNVLLARASNIDADSRGFLRSSIFVGPQYHFLSISLLQQCQIQICSSLLFILACKWKSWFSDFNTIAQIRYHGYTWSNWEQTVLILSYLLFWSPMTWWSTPGLYCPRHTGSLWPTVPLLIC